MKAKIKDLTIGLDGKQQLTLALHSDFRQDYDRLKDKELAVEIKPYRARRSMDANAYAWVLMGRLAEALRSTKDEVYLQMLERYGQSGLVKIRERDKETILKEIKYYKVHEKLFDEKASYYHIFVGSSNYNTEEMAVLIDGIVDECKTMGIETMTPEELDRIKHEWGEN